MHNIKDLINPKKYNFPLNLSKLQDVEILKDFLKKMLTIRLIEKKLAKEKKLGVIGGPVHLGVGQEAVAVALSKYLKKSDRVFGAHRSHSHILSLGSDMTKFFAEILGKSSGLSRGMGGSMHLWDKPNGFYGSVPIVAGTVPLALGAGLAAKMDNNKEVSIAYLGDSALEEGIVQESLNIASLMNIPIIFVVENNLFGSHMDIVNRQPFVSTIRFAHAHGIEYELVDGNDVIEMAIISEKLIMNARKNNKPGFIEAITYRWYGHVDWREDVDVGVNRSSEDLKNWKMRDPIDRLFKSMINKKMITDDEFSSFKEVINNKITHAWKIALDEAYPKKSDLIDHVYKI